MAITSTSTLAPSISTETINALTLGYLRAACFLPNLVRNVDLTGAGSLKHDFNSFGSLVAAATTQGTDLTPAAMPTSEDGTVTAAEVGVAVEVTRIALLATGGRIDEDALAREIAAAVQLNIETAIALQFADASASVGSTGVDFSLANFDDMLLGLRQANAPTVAPANFNLPAELAGYQFVGAEVQYSDFMRALQQAGLVVLGVPNSSGFDEAGRVAANAMRGTFKGVKLYATNANTTANAGADVVGAMLCPGAIGLVTLGGPTIETEVHTLGRSKYIVGSQIYGTDVIKQAFIQKAVTDA